MRRLRRLCGLLVVTACVAPPPRAAGPAPFTAAPIDTLALRAHTRFLAQDALRGRGTGDPLTRVAAEYIASQCMALGLLPIGEAFLHPVPLRDAALDSTSWVLVTGGTDSVRTVPGGDFHVRGGSLAQLGSPITGAAFWAGDPDSLPATLPDLAGRIAVTVGLPDGAQGTRLADAGAAALVALAGDDATVERIAQAYGTPLWFAEPAPSSHAAPVPVVVAGTRLTRALVPVLRGARRDVTLVLAPHPRPVSAWNVGCRLPGADATRRDTAIAFTAHYDHLGVGAPVNGDSIYNGFSDDAAGVAMVLAIAKSLREPPASPPRHTMLFLFFTGEERGLLGSDWWVAHPAWPVERMRAVINLDAGAPPARVWSWRLAGGTDSWLGVLGQDVAASYGWTASLSAPRANSDYFPFHRRGVAAVFPIPTPAPYEGLSTDSSQALRARWDAYHQARDEWHEDFPFAGLARYAFYARAIGLAADER